MAISIKSMNGLAAIKKIGIPQDLFDWLEKSPVQVALNASKFTFTVSIGGEKQQVEVPVTLNQLQQLNAGTLPLPAKIDLQNQLVKAVGSLKAQEGSVVVEDDSGPSLGEILQQALKEKPKSVLDKLPPIKKEATKPAKEGAWPMFDVSKINSAEPVKLRDATMMYQPVMGTSAGSRYFMVGANQDVRVAARYTGGKLSVRIEGPSWQKYASNISSCGFDNVDKAKDYASLHLNVGTEMVVASKTMGAILMGLGIPLQTPVPELKVIAK